jgi:2-alkenal reductase
VRRGVLALTAGLALAGCGGASGEKDDTATKTVTEQRTITVQEPAPSARPADTGGRGFDPQKIYKDVSPGVVTVVSVFRGGDLGGLLGGGGDDDERSGVGSGFVLDENGEIATNAHVITNGEGNRLRRARSVFVQFGDGNQVPAKIVGADPNVDVALIKIDPKGLDLKPIALGTSKGLTVGEPVAAIGSPFSEPQSLSTGVISALDRTIESLAGRFGISGAIQTDAAINHGNSGGPLLDGRGRVLGINSQIQSTGGGGEGVGFAVPVDAVKRSLSQLRDDGEAEYAYLGVSSVAVFPQLAAKFDLPVRQGAWVQEVSEDGPAGDAGIEAGRGTETFQASRYTPDGDVITAVDGRKLARQADLSEIIAAKRPGETVSLTVYADGDKKTVRVKLGSRPAGANP